MAPWPEGRRFRVGTCEGWRAMRAGGRQRVPGLGAYVMDAAYAFRVVCSFESEDFAGGSRSTLTTRAMALAAAHAAAAELEAKHAALALVEPLSARP